MGRRRLLWVVVIVFVLIGGYLAATRDFEEWAGGQLEKAAPTARHVIPLPAKKVIRESRERLPVYGPAPIWLARKSASIVYFGVVALFVLALRKRKPASLGETLLVTLAAGTGMSAIVELLEMPFGEAFTSELFDLACGMAGGFAAGLIAWLWLRRKASNPSDKGFA